MNKKILLRALVGSRLYGTNTAKSDYDYFGIYKETTEVILKDYLNGEIKGREINCSIISKDETGKNNKDAIDDKYFSIKKMMTSLMNQNPNMLELLFIPKENIIKTSPFYELLVENRELFLSKKIYYSFTSYAANQTKKAFVKKERKEKIKVAVEYLNSFKEPEKIEIESLKVIPKENKTLDDISKNDETNFYKIFEQNGKRFRIIGTNESISKWTLIEISIANLSTKYFKDTFRNDLIEKFGYDTKFVSNTIRLYLESIELFENHKITLPLKESKLIKEIKEGKYTEKEIKELLKEYELKLQNAMKNTTLPENIDQEKIEKLFIDYLAKGENE